jgi:hypothetical protein
LLTAMLLLTAPHPSAAVTGRVDLSTLTWADAWKLHGQRVVARVHLGTPGYELDGVAVWGNFGDLEAAVYFPAALAREIEDQDKPFFARGVLKIVRVKGWPGIAGWTEVRLYVEALGLGSEAGWAVQAQTAERQRDRGQAAFLFFCLRPWAWGGKMRFAVGRQLCGAKPPRRLRRGSIGLRTPVNLSGSEKAFDARGLKSPKTKRFYGVMSKTFCGPT